MSESQIFFPPPPTPPPPDPVAPGDGAGWPLRLGLTTRPMVDLVPMANPEIAMGAKELNLMAWQVGALGQLAPQAVLVINPEGPVVEFASFSWRQNIYLSQDPTNIPEVAITIPGTGVVQLVFDATQEGSDYQPHALTLRAAAAFPMFTGEGGSEDPDLHAVGRLQFQVQEQGVVPFAPGMAILLGPDLVEWTVTSVEILDPGTPEPDGYGEYVECFVVCAAEGEEYLLPNDTATNAELPGYPGLLYPDGGHPESVAVLGTEMPTASAVSPCRAVAVVSGSTVTVRTTDESGAALSAPVVVVVH